MITTLFHLWFIASGLTIAIATFTPVARRNPFSSSPLCLMRAGRSGVSVVNASPSLRLCDLCAFALKTSPK